MRNVGQNKRNSVFLIICEDEFLASKEAKKVVNQFLPAEEQSMGLESIDGNVESASEAVQSLDKCLEAVRTIGFFTASKVVWLRWANFLNTGNINKSQAVQEMISTLCSTLNAGLADSQKLIITTPAVNPKSAILTTCEQIGKIIQIKIPKPWSRDKIAIQNASAAFKKFGLQIAGDVLNAFVEKVGTDTRQLEQEIYKLSIYLDKRKNVNKEDISALVSNSRDMFNWDLDDAIANRLLPRSLKILQQLLFQKHEPIAILTSVANHFRYLLIFREALDNQWIQLGKRRGSYSPILKGKISPEMDSFLLQALSADKRKTNPFAQLKLANEASTYKQKDLMNAYNLILQTRQKLVRSSAPASLLLQILVIKICSIQTS